MPALTPDLIAQFAANALAEDIQTGDVTTTATIPPHLHATAVMVAREPLVLAGIDLAVAAFRQLSSEIQTTRQAADGNPIPSGGVLLELSGPAQPILTAERVALNFVQRLSGIATLTSRFVAAVQGTGAQILDTRKTTPGWRVLEKYAVACGGGKNHRFGLFDQILIKDNHLAALAGEPPNPIAAAIRRSRERFPGLQVEIETDSLAQVEQALDAHPDMILLDNMSIAQLRQAVQLIAQRAQTEASGGVTLDTVRAIAQTGVTFISAGALTHSARAVDIALDFTYANSAVFPVQ